jgi:hypothetical protein
MKNENKIKEEEFSMSSNRRSETIDEETERNDTATDFTLLGVSRSFRFLDFSDQELSK